MTKETTLNELGAMMEHIVKYIVNMPAKDDVEKIIERIVEKQMKGLATKEQVFALQTQMNSLETQLCGMNHGKLEVRVGDLEEEVFGEIRT